MSWETGPSKEESIDIPTLSGDEYTLVFGTNHEDCVIRIADSIFKYVNHL
jgi:hypothetical protein